MQCVNYEGKAKHFSTGRTNTCHDSHCEKLENTFSMLTDGRTTYLPTVSVGNIFDLASSQIMVGERMG